MVFNFYNLIDKQMTLYLHLLACIAATQDVRHPSGYFKMLRHLESCIAALWQGLEFSRRAIDTKLFD
jgi:hypothetical protein